VIEFEEIFRTYFSDVYLYVMGLSGDSAVADEITSETFLKAMRSIDGFRGDCDIRVWLCQIAKNTYYSYAKKNKRITLVEDAGAELADQGGSVDEAVATRDEAMRIHRILHSLPEPYKEVFMLRAFGELSFAHIGKVFGKTENWACVTYHRARTKIKERMEATHVDD